MAKIEPKTWEEMYPDKPSSGEAEKQYPYGTSLELSDELAKAVGAADMAVGEEVVIKAKAFVKRKSINEDKDNSRVDICFQMTEVDVEAAEPDRVKELYGE